MIIQFIDIMAVLFFTGIAVIATVTISIIAVIYLTAKHIRKFLKKRNTTKRETLVKTE